MVVCAPPWVKHELDMSWWSAAARSPWVANYIVHAYRACIHYIKKRKRRKEKKKNVMCRGNINNHNTIPLPLQSKYQECHNRRMVICWDNRRDNDRLWNFTFEADKLRAIGSVVQVWIADGTKEESERCNRWRYNVGESDKILNGAVTAFGPSSSPRLMVYGTKGGEGSHCSRGRDWKIKGSVNVPSLSTIVKFSFVSLSSVGPQWTSTSSGCSSSCLLIVSCHNAT